MLGTLLHNFTHIQIIQRSLLNRSWYLTTPLAVFNPFFPPPQTSLHHKLDMLLCFSNTLVLKIFACDWKSGATCVGGQRARCDPAPPAGDKRCCLVSRRCLSLSLLYLHSNPAVPIQSAVSGGRWAWWIIREENDRPWYRTLRVSLFNLLLWTTFFLHRW